MSRLIAHVDMDAFFASVEQRDNPEFAGKPVIVGGSGGRGVVAAASYEVRKYGVHSAMPAREALRRCPDAICVRPRIGHYRDVSRQIFAVFREFTDLVEGLSLDEAFLDLSELAQPALRLGQEIKRRIRSETDLTASVGIGPNKLVAKIASDLDKPDGLCIVSPHHVNEILDPLPVRTISGIGPKTEKKLTQLGIRTIRDLRTCPEQQLRQVFGRYTSRMQARASGIDDRPVQAHGKRKSISSEETFDNDISDHKILLTEITQLAEGVAATLRKKELVAAVISIKVRNREFITRTRQRHISPPDNDSGLVVRTARELLQRWLVENPGQPIRLLGVGVAELSPARQLGLFEAQPESSALDRAMDRIRDRFGDDSIGRGPGQPPRPK